jgi:hypothetical protein
MADSNNVVDLGDQADVDAEILRQRLSGLSIKRLSRAFGISEGRVLKSLDRSLPKLSPELKVRLYKEDLARLDELLHAFYPLAKTGSSSAAQTCIKLIERRACMVGSDAPTKVDILVEKRQVTNSTEDLLRELDRIAAERPAPKLIAGTDIEVDPDPEAPPDVG